MRPAILLLCPLLAASAIAQPITEPLDRTVDRARAEQAAAEAETARLERAAAKARDEAEKLRAEQAAAAQAIDAAEARITAAEAELRLASAQVAAQRQRLAAEQQPVAALLAGLAIMGERPPILALVDAGGTDELVKMRVLLDVTLPVIRRRTAAVSAQLQQAQQLDAAAGAARAELVRSRQALLERRNRFAALEQQALRSAGVAAGGAISSGDRALAAGETVEQLAGSEADRRAALSIASVLASDEPSPPRPLRAAPAISPVPFPYTLPVSGEVTDGLGAVNASGIRSRGVTIAAPRGVNVAAPASGIVRFAGPFRDYDGVVIIEHRGGWMSVLLNVGGAVKPGQRVRIGDPVGRALGPVGVELSQNGRRFSPALIAGSSQTLSKGSKGG